MEVRARALVFGGRASRERKAVCLCRGAAARPCTEGRGQGKILLGWIAFSKYRTVLRVCADKILLKAHLDCHVGVVFKGGEGSFVQATGGGGHRLELVV